MIAKRKEKRKSLPQIFLHFSQEGINRVEIEEFYKKKGLTIYWLTP